MGRSPKAKKKTKTYCGKCSKEVHDQDESVGCEVCDRWYHYLCSDLDEETFDFLCKTDSEHIFYKCEKCPGFSNDSTKLVDLIDNQLDQLECMKKELTSTKKLVAENFTKLLSKVESNKKSVDDHITISKTYAEALQTNATKSEETKKVISNINNNFKHLQNNIQTKLEQDKEAEEREKKKLNVILFNIPESTSENTEEQEDEDIAFLKKIFSEKIVLKQEDIKAIYRLPRNKNNSNSPTISL